MIESVFQCLSTAIEEQQNFQVNKSLRKQPEIRVQMGKLQTNK